MDFLLDDSEVYRVPVLLQMDWLEHGFGTALSVNWPGDAKITTVKQIHSDLILVADGSAGCIGEGDAMITNRPGTLLSIRTADCLPILIADPIRHNVAAVHAGWRGTVAKIASKTVDAVVREFGTDPRDLVVAIGPGIGPCCFEVGPEVAEHFRELFPERDDLDRGTHVDLVAANVRQLGQVGLRMDQVVTLGECTCCGGGRFHSFRRDRESSGRMVSSIGIRLL